MRKIATATYKGDLLIDFVFTDGHKNRVDFAPFFMASPNELIEPFRETALFQTFQIGPTGQSIFWGEDQAVSFGIDSIYDRAPVYVPVSATSMATYLAYLAVD